MTNNSRYDRAQRMLPRTDPRRKAATYHATPLERLKIRFHKSWMEMLQLVAGATERDAVVGNVVMEEGAMEPRRTSLVATLRAVNPGFNSHLV